VLEVIERAEGRYESHEVEFGTVYRWYPESVVAECACGERSILTISMTTCGECGADYAASVQKELNVRQPRDEVVHPWRYDTNREREGLNDELLALSGIE
jgi:hypothetical protein